MEWVSIGRRRRVQGRGAVGGAGGVLNGVWRPTL